MDYRLIIKHGPDIGKVFAVKKNYGNYRKKQRVG